MVSVKGFFRVKDVLQLTGLTYRQLDYWDRSGFISPSVAAAAGPGTERLYSFRDVVALKVAKRLR
ncbi:MAG: MerR family transcriptional regulator [Firmicutes bacterium]|nr:MerR family transcriptional regulator [Bacillota bacterium]